MDELWKWRIRNATSLTHSLASNENVAQRSHETSTANNQDLSYTLMQHIDIIWAA